MFSFEEYNVHSFDAVVEKQLEKRDCKNNKLRLRFSAFINYKRFIVKVPVN